jgi:RND family efflux transporter MFP subunit
MATHETAKLNLEFTRVLSPIDGRIGRRLLDPGNLVKADETVLAVVVSVDPMYVFFQMDETTLLQLRAAENKQPRAEPLTAAIGVATDEGYPRQATVDFVDSRVDPKTATIEVRAVLPNVDRLLLPGMFARLRLTMGPAREVFLLPDRAIGSDDKGRRSVFVVDDKNVVQSRVVKIAEHFETSRVVLEGLRPEDRVIWDSIAPLSVGMRVMPQEGPLPRPGIK